MMAYTLLQHSVYHCTGLTRGQCLSPARYILQSDLQWRNRIWNHSWAKFY